ncbi:glycosyltransferase family 92 protein F13G3.3-like [Python bivittatus]|uniref:Glycosyltransferase family 92 protein n=1 Tax=Python bivittatus TaxID=176946 RepID=A0A9F2QU01_PYTBI|nr:glycosyltransferase family 92 protein F13G3.3-like [Python bivittatus]
MYKILGAQKVTIYKNSCSPLMEKVLDYYISEGTVEIIPWPIHLYLKVSSYWHHSMGGKDIGYYGQIAALKDCIYRNMYRSKYVVLIDADEVILPIKDADWKSLMQRMEKGNPRAGVFLFENQVFRNNVFSRTPFNFSLWSMVPGVNMFEHIHKEPNRTEGFNNRKMIVDPRKVIQTSVHSVLKMHGETSIQVSSQLAINFHCRTPEHKDLPENALVQDSIFWRYNKTLTAKVNNALLKSSILGANDPAQWQKR